MFDIGKEMYSFAEKIFPICRSITGDGARKTLKAIQDELPDMKIKEVPTGTQVFDWTVPKEWNIKDAYVTNGKGEKIIDFKKSNLHVMGYSLPVDENTDLKGLLEHVYVEENQPDAIPYVTSYYKERFGFCMTRNMRDSLKEDIYHMFIDSELKEGSLSYGELIIPGKSKEEIFISTYVCHPSMANNELSGPAVSTWFAKYIKDWYSKEKGHYTYRFIYIPETIGSLTYCSIHLKEMKENIKAGFLLSCVGDNLTYSYIPTRKGKTLADRVALNVLSTHYPDFVRYSFLDRGSDERQYNSPGVDLPVCALCRTKFGAYPEYHTSLDDMTVISPEGLEGSYELLIKISKALEYYGYYHVNVCGEPQLGKRGLYPTISKKGSYDSILAMRDFLAYADGETDLFEISDIIKVPVSELIPIIDKMVEQGLVDYKRTK